MANLQVISYTIEISRDIGGQSATLSKDPQSNGNCSDYGFC
jgi:hypothetical protein